MSQASASTSTPRYTTAVGFVYSAEYLSKIRAIERVVNELESLATYASSRYDVEPVYARGTEVFNEFTEFAYSEILNNLKGDEAREAREFVREAERTLMNRLDDARDEALQRVDWDEDER